MNLYRCMETILRKWLILRISFFLHKADYNMSIRYYKPYKELYDKNNVDSLK